MDRIEGAKLGRGETRGHCTDLLVEMDEIEPPKHGLSFIEGRGRPTTEAGCARDLDGGNSARNESGGSERC